MTTSSHDLQRAANRAAALAEAEAHIQGQHVVSKVVIKNFAAPVEGSLKIGVHNTIFGPTRPIGAGKAGLAPNLLRVGTTSAEKLWARTENRLGKAIESVRLDGAQAPALDLFILRKAAALHFIRNKETVEVLDQTWPKRAPRLIDQLVDRYRERLTQIFITEHKRRPTNADLVALASDWTSAGTHANETGAWTRGRVEDLFKTLTYEDSTPRRIELLRPRGTKEFLIADNPVTTHLWDTGHAPTAMRIGWYTSDETIMPFTPDLALCLIKDESGRSTSSMPVDDVDVSDARLTELNERQIWAAKDYIFHRPGRLFTADISRALQRKAAVAP